MIRSAVDAPSRLSYRRRTHYIDKSIQRSFLVAMVMLETTLVVASIWLAHWRLTSLIDAGMYRVHFVQTTPTLMQLAPEGLGVFGLFAAINLIALLVTEYIWAHRNSLVLQDFTGLVGKTRELDFSIDAATTRQHDVLSLAAAWRAKERAHFIAIREQVAKLEVAAALGESPQNLRNSLENLKGLLS